MGTGTTDRTELTDADRAVLQDHLDEYLESDGRAGLEFSSPAPFPRARGGYAAGNVIDFRRAKLHFAAARSMDAAAPGAPTRTAETLRQLAEDFRARARGAPPVRG